MPVSDNHRIHITNDIWKVDTIMENSTAHQIRELREDEQTRYRETQLREDRAAAESLRPKPPSAASIQEREAYLRRGDEKGAGIMGAVLVLLIFAFVAYLFRFAG